MALIVEQHVVAASYPTSSVLIRAGMLVSLSAGAVVPATDDAATVLGISGDSTVAPADEALTTAYGAELHTGAQGASTRFTSNRVSDFYNEALASGKITVYNGGGRFWISSDLWTVAPTALTPTAVYPSATDGLWNITGTNVVGIATDGATAYSSGVPGSDMASGDEQEGSMTLGDYVPVILRI